MNINLLGDVSVDVGMGGQVTLTTDPPLPADVVTSALRLYDLRVGDGLSADEQRRLVEVLPLISGTVVYTSRSAA